MEHSFNSVFGNFNTISLLRRDIVNDASGKLLIFHGDVGTGKSSTAVIYSLGYCCENNKDGDPCLECPTCRANLEALRRKQNSSRIKLVNMGLYRRSSEANNLIDEIFNLQNFGRTVYVLEEFHLLPKDVQSNFLREIDNMQEDLKVVITTSSLRGLDDAIVSRANKFLFSKLSKEEARALVKCKVPEVRFSQEAVDYLIESSGYIPRDILVNLSFLLKTNASEEEAKGYLQYVSVGSILQVFAAALDGDLQMMRLLLSDLKTKAPASSVQKSLKQFCIQALYLVSGCSGGSFTANQRERIVRLFSEDLLFKVVKILDNLEFNHDYALDSFFFKVVMLNKPETLGKVLTNVKEDAKMVSKQTEMTKNVVDEVRSHSFTKLSKESFEE